MTYPTTPLTEFLPAGPEQADPRYRVPGWEDLSAEQHAWLIERENQDRVDIVAKLAYQYPEGVDSLDLQEYARSVSRFYTRMGMGHWLKDLKFGSAPPDSSRNLPLR